MARYKRREERCRLNLEITKVFREEIEKLRVETEADSLTEVVRLAIKTYKKFHSLTKDGYTVVLRSKENVEVEALLLF